MVGIIIKCIFLLGSVHEFFVFAIRCNFLLPRYILHGNYISSVIIYFIVRVVWLLLYILLLGLLVIIRYN